eukprot:2429803-Lingulodinium_polyedra.AAC.1
MLPAQSIVAIGRQNTAATEPSNARPAGTPTGPSASQVCLTGAPCARLGPTNGAACPGTRGEAVASQPPLGARAPFSHNAAGRPPRPPKVCAGSSGCAADA